MSINSKPIGKMSKKDFSDLAHEWRLKLKESGFQDIERWSNNNNSQNQGFVGKGHIHWEYYKTSENFNHFSTTYNEYFSVLSTYIYNSPNFPKKYFKILEDYLLTGNLSVSFSNNTDGTIKYNTLATYLSRNYPKMIKFAIDFNRKNQDD